MTALAPAPLYRQSSLRTVRRRSRCREYLEHLESRQLMAADLAPTITSVPIDTVNGTTRPVSVEVFNLGDTDFRSRTVIDLYALADGSSSPIFLNRVTRTGSIEAGESRTFNLSARINASLVTGNYRLMAVVDPDDRVSELDETNNTAVSEPFSVTQREIDLAAGFSPNLPNITRVIAGTPGSGTAFVTVRNNGTSVIPGGTSVRVDVLARPVGASDESFDLDITRRTFNVGVGGLLPGQSRLVPVSVQFPRTAPVGTYLLVAGVDIDNTVAETNEDNNVAVANSVVNVFNISTIGSLGLVPLPTPGGNSLTGISIGSFVPSSGTIPAAPTTGTIPIIGNPPSGIGNPPLNSTGLTPTSTGTTPTSSMSLVTTSGVNNSLTTSIGTTPLSVGRTTLMTV
jgi:hypothetical protein